MFARAADDAKTWLNKSIELAKPFNYNDFGCTDAYAARDTHYELVWRQLNELRLIYGAVYRDENLAVIEIFSVGRGTVAGGVGCLYVATCTLPTFFVRIYYLFVRAKTGSENYLFSKTKQLIRNGRPEPKECEWTR